MKNEEKLIKKKEINENEISEEEKKKNIETQLNKEILDKNEKIYSEYLDLNENSRPTFRFNFAEIIRKAREHSDDKNFYNEIEFDCNICINSLKIDKALKIDSFTLISYIHYNNSDYNYIFYLINKFINYIQKYKGVESFIYIKILFRASGLLLEKNNLFYSYYYNFLANQISEQTKIHENAKKSLSDLTNSIKIKIDDYILKYKNIFLNFETFNFDKISELITIINGVENENITDDNNYYIINKLWVERAKNFIIQYEKLRKENNEKNIKFFIKKSLDNEYIYSKYLGEELTGIIIKEKDQTIPIFPGPIDNYSITLFKDNYIDPLNIQDNYFIKDNLKKNKDYYLINKEKWDYLDHFFLSTNKLIRKGKDTEFIFIKCLILEKRLKIYKYINFIKRRYLQISKNEKVTDLKLKIIRILNEIDKEEREKIEKLMRTDSNPLKRKKNLELRGLIDDEEENEKLETEKNIIKSNKKISDYDKIETNNNQNNYIIDFYILPYEKKDILSEISIAYINYIELIKYDIKKIEIDDNLTMDKFPYNGLKKSGNILLIEVHKNNDINFLNENDNKCFNCNKEIKNDEFKCNKCHLNQYCSYECSKENKIHNIIDLKLSKYLRKEFNLKKLFQTQLSDIIDKDNTIHGLSGLKNLGNTCYINSALQCLSNTEDLTKYILKDYYIRDINHVNKLGYKGQLISQYSKLIKLLWERKLNFEIEGNDKSNLNLLKYIDPINPKELRNYIGIILKKFSTNKQQDSHEFISLFLENLHEDINRITNKPYLELEEKKNGESDEEASERWWKYHRLRENSIISDLFYGQFKSKIVCFDCNNISITYDPFMCLSLSLPISPMKINLKFFNMGNCFILDVPVWDNCKVYHLKNICFEFIKGNDYDDKDKNFDLFEVVVLDKEKIICNIVKNDDQLVMPYLEEKKEICIYKRDSINHFNIYLYQVNLILENSFFRKNQKLNFISYPIGISITEKTTIEELLNKIQRDLNYIFDDNIKENKLFNILIYHNYKEKSFNWFSTQQSCEFCNQSYSSPNFCNILSNFTKTNSILNVINKLRDNRPLILLIHSDHFIKQSLFKNKDILINEYINEEVIEKKEKSNLYGSLNIFKREERLNDDVWFCNKCNNFKSASKKLSINKSPNYLIIHLKRFNIKNSLFSNKLSSEKNDCFIDFPIKNFDLSNNVDGKDKGNSIYDLYGVIEHYGRLSYGHYIAKCKNFGKWYEFNDDRVCLINTDKIVTQNAYILFYKKKGLENEF